MLNIKSLVLIAVSIFLAVKPAYADWQFTRWGMSSEELKKASPVGIINGCTGYPGNHDTEYTSNWLVGNMKFVACYRFMNDKLYKINLYSKNVDGEAIVKGLTQKHGDYTSYTVNSNLADTNVTSYEWNLSNEKIIFSSYANSEHENLYVVTYISKKGSNEVEVRDKV